MSAFPTLLRRNLLVIMQVGVRGKDVVVLGVEKKSVLQLQDPRTVRKVAMLDDHICLAFAGDELDSNTLDFVLISVCQGSRLTAGF
jgi:20S proteasome alpha/beta subunit